MTTYTSRSKITRFSLPAEHSASSVLRRFIREIARGTNLSTVEVTELQLAVTEAFSSALTQQKLAGEGRIALKIDPHIKLLPCVATNKESVKRVLLELLYTILETASD